MDGSNILSEKDLSDNIHHKISISHDRVTIYLDVNYMDNKFSIQKSYMNNYFGLAKLDADISSFDSEEKIRAYFNLGE